MATLPMPESTAFRARRGDDDLIRSLLRLNDAAQKINSILDLDTLLDRIVNDIVTDFGCVETEILLKDGNADEVVVAAIQGCTQVAKHERFVIGRDGLVGHVAATGRTSYTPDVTKEPRYIACEPSTRSELDIPLVARGQIIGVLSVQHHEVDGFPPEQRALLEALAGHIGVAIENARQFQQERAEIERMRSREQEAHRIQQALFPKAAPAIPGFNVDGHCIPAGAVGGDWYDFFPLRAHRWGLVLADVAGKGMAAALLMSATRGILRSVAERAAGPAEVLLRLNRVLLNDLPPEKFVTMVYAVLDPARRTLTFANAGHPWPVFRDGGAPQLVKNDAGLPLGIADCEFDERVLALDDGARVLFYSDGITEAANPSGEEYGLERLVQRSAAPQLSPAAVLDDVCRFTEPQPLADDATVIVLQAEERPQLNLF